jgi:hypothetical protein
MEKKMCQSWQISDFQVKGKKMKNRNTTSFWTSMKCHKNWLISKMEDSLKEFTSALSFLALLRQ